MYRGQFRDLVHPRVFIELKIHHKASGPSPVQDFWAGTGYSCKWTRIPKFSSLGFFVLVFLFSFLCFNAKIFKWKWDFCLLFFFFIYFSLQLSLLLQATGPVYIIVLVTVALSHVVTTGILEVNAAAPSGAHSQVLQEGSKAGGGMRLCLPLAECQNPSRYQCLQTPGRSSHTWLPCAPQSRIPGRNPLSGLHRSPGRWPPAC